MGFDDLLKKGQEYVGGQDGKVDYKQYQEDATDAYTEFNKKDGSFLDKAKSAYGEIQKNHAGNAQTDSSNTNSNTQSN